MGEIWDALIIWTETNGKNGNMEEKEVECEQKKLLNGFVKHVRFNQMNAAYFKEHIVDKMILPPNDIINILFSMQNGTKFKSPYNDTKRLKSKTTDTFQLEEVCYSLQQIQSLQKGESIDFRDFYGLFCGATIEETDHAQNKIKVHYNAWGSTYDEWYKYLSTSNDSDSSDNDEEDNSDDHIIITQKDRNSRIAPFGAITARSIKRECFRKQIEGFDDILRKEESEQIRVKLPNWFWKKNEGYIQNKHLYSNKWLNAKIIAHKTSAKYCDHVKIGIYVDNDHYEYWIHPDNDEEIRLRSDDDD